ncbi:MAG: hypothetical protein AB7H77_10945 [Bdellovibrionales bacterium]
MSQRPLNGVISPHMHDPDARPKIAAPAMLDAALPSTPAQAEARRLEWARNLFALGLPSASDPPAPAATNAGSSDTLPAATGGRSYTSLKCGMDRRAPPEVLALFKEGKAGIGTVAVFDGIPGYPHGHAQMCVGFDEKTGEPVWCSDTVQAGFYCNGAYEQKGTFSLYNCTKPGYDPHKAAQNLLANARANYGGDCALFVRKFGMPEGTQGAGGSARHYNIDGKMEERGYAEVFRGGPAAAVPDIKHEIRAAEAAPRSMAPAV